MTAHQKAEAARALAVSAPQQARISRENAAAQCVLCQGTGSVDDSRGEWRGACVCGAADNKKGEKQ